MPVLGATNPMKSTSDGSDFYFLVLERDAVGLLFGAYYGGNGTIFNQSAEHVDGGTSRFDREGVIYQAVCAGCGGNSLFPTTTGAWSQTNNSNNCNLGVIKIEFDLSGTDVDFTANPTSTGCVPLTVTFQSQLQKVNQVQWDFGDGGTSTAFNPTHTYTDTGIFEVRLIGIDSTSCNIADTAYTTIWVRDDSVSARFLDLTTVNCTTLTASFDAMSNSMNPSYNWNFGDGNSSTSKSPTHTYNGAGTYNVSLFVTDPTSCNGNATFAAPITIEPFVNLDITLSDTAGCFPFPVTFNNTTSSAGDFFWGFWRRYPLRQLKALPIVILPEVYMMLK